MKFSFRQILASTAGAVIAALIASTFGVKGTIIGVAIGSAAATFGTALVAQSIEHGQKAVKQVVVRAPDSSPLLRKLGATGASGDRASSVGDSAAPTAAMAASGADAETVEIESPTESVGETGRLEISAVAGAPASERMQASTTPVLASGQTGRRFTWTAIAGTAAIVFVLALMFITAIELISGKPLAAIFGNAGSGTSVHDFFRPSPSPTPSPTTTTTSPTTSTSTSSSTTTSASTTTTSTTAPTGTSTTTTSPGTSTTTTSGNPAVSGTSTTTTAPNR